MKVNRWLLSVLIACIPLIGVSLTPALSQADVIFTFDSVYSGTSPTTGVDAPPWLTATFSDLISGGVHLKMEANVQSLNEYISEVYFNLNPDLSIANLGFNNATTQPTTIATGADQFHAPGDGLYDILFSFPTKGNQNRFNGSETYEYDIFCSSCNGFSADSFNVLGSPANQGDNAGPFTAVAKIQGILLLLPDGTTTTTSGMISDPPASVPEPGTLLLLGSGLIGIGAFGRRLRKRG